ncbi:Small acidic protein 1 [Bienertia sinuspersici]
MKQIPADYLADMDDHGTTIAMDVDDVDALDVFGEGLMTPDNNKLADADFFNFFPDDFDDTDIN